MNLLRKILGSPIKLMAFLSILWGTIIGLYLFAYIHYNSLFIWMISGGISLYLVELVFSKKRVKKKTYWTVQVLATALVGGICVLAYLQSTAKTDFIFKNTDEFIIVYEMEGYPPLPKTLFWRKTIHVPDNGILISSSSVLELPVHSKNYFDKKGNAIKMQRQYNSEYCSDNQVSMSVDYFATKMLAYHIPCGESDVQIAFQNLFDSMCKGEIISNFIETVAPKNRHSTRDMWCEEYKKNLESFELDE